MQVYKTTNLINGKIYVGKDVREKNRYLGSGKLIILAIKKYGKKNFKKEILEQCDTMEFLSEREIYWIDKLNARDSKIGYNLTMGGEGCADTSWGREYKPLSDETKTKISKSKTGYKWGHHTEATKKIMSEKRMGIEFTDEHKKKLSIARKKRVTTEETKRRMSIASKGKINIKKYVLIDPNGKEYITENGLTMFCEQHNLTASNMRKVLIGSRNHHKGWKIRWFKNDN